MTGRLPVGTQLTDVEKPTKFSGFVLVGRLRPGWRAELSGGSDHACTRALCRRFRYSTCSYDYQQVAPYLRTYLLCTDACPISLRRTRVMLTRPGTMEGKGQQWRQSPPPRHKRIQTRTVPNLVAIHSSGPGISISSVWIHLVDSWSDVTGRTPPPGTVTLRMLH